MCVQVYDWLLSVSANQLQSQKFGWPEIIVEGILHEVPSCGTEPGTVQLGSNLLTPQLIF